MWEAIASNRRRSWLLVCVMGVVLVVLGGIIGLVVDPHAGGYFGVAGALALWLILWATAAGAGDSILLSSARARQIEKQDAPQLWNIVEEMTIASGLPQMPRVYVIDDAGLNAFAVGYRSKRAAVAVTSGLLKRLTRDELQGVVAHEIGHIRNQDVRFMTMAAVMVGAIVLMSHGFLRGVLYGGGRRRSSSRGGGGQGQLVVLAIGVGVAILAPLCARLLYLACSRRREFLADASGARFTRFPPGLASALEKISGGMARGREMNQAIAPLYIVNPLQSRSRADLFSTHPSTEERVRVLRGMAGAGYAAYEAAYQRLHGANAHAIGRKTLDADQDVAVREPTPEPKGKEQAVARAREVGELLDHIINFTVIPCVCGVRLKIPPKFKRKTLACPRCGRKHTIPDTKQPPAAAPAARFHRRGTGWETFQCDCGHAVQISPSFRGRHIRCPKCRKLIEIVSEPG